MTTTRTATATATAVSGAVIGLVKLRGWSRGAFAMVVRTVGERRRKGPRGDRGNAVHWKAGAAPVLHPSAVL